ncbi:MAG: hypothetical protein FJ091_04485 [Deltaproteobacteria bacterium]|nr:hypothetical protein [Deltaproteobacteria bacterium]
MKVVRVIAIVLVVYVAIVAIFESLIGYLQPAGDGTLVITTFDADGAAHDRVVSKLDVDGALYVAANHWPRAWYSRALAKPEVEATIDGEKRAYSAVPVTGAEHDHVNTQKALGLVFRVLTGFPPRYFLRLDPR